MYKQTGVLCLSLLLALGSAACSNDTNQAPASTKVSSGDVNEASAASNAEEETQVTELRVLIPQDAGYDRLLAQWDHLREDISISTSTYDSMNGSLKIELLQQELSADLVLIPQQQLKQWKDAGKELGAAWSDLSSLEDAQDVLEEQVLWANAWVSDSATGAIYGIPAEVDPLLLMYNFKVLQEAELASSTQEAEELLADWSAWNEIQKKLYDRTGILLFSDATKLYNVQAEQLLSSVSLEHVTKAEDWLSILKPAFDHTAEYMYEQKKTLQDNFMKLSVGSPSAVKLIRWSELLKYRNENANDLGIWGITSLPGKPIIADASYWTIPIESAKKEAAFETVEWLTTESAPEARFTEHAILPSAVDSLESSKISNYADVYYHGSLGEVAANIALQAEPPASVQLAIPEHVTSAILSALQSVELQGIEPAIAWEKVVDQVKL